MSHIPVPLEILYPEMGPGSANHSHDTDDVDYDDNTVIIFIAARDGAQKRRIILTKPPTIRQ